MRLLYFYLLISLSSQAALGSELPKNFLQSGCKIIDDFGTSRFEFSGDICLFLSDGSYFSFTEKEKLIQKINPDNKVIWKKNTEKIRSMNLSYDKKSLLVLSSMVKKNLFCNARTDVVERINVKSGKTVARLNGDEAVDMLALGRGSVPILMPVKQNVSESKKSYDCTFLAFAAVSEIAGEPQTQPTNQLLGNIILYTDPAIRSNYILSQDLKKIVWSAAQVQRDEAIFQNIIYHDYIYVISTFATAAQQIKISKLNFQNKKLIWSKDFQLDPGFRPIYHSAVVPKDQLIIQTKKEDSGQFMDYEFDPGGHFIEKKSPPTSVADLQSKLYSDFLKNRGQ